MFSVFKKFREGLRKTASAALGGLASAFGRKIDEGDIERIEETLVGADFGLETALEIADAVRREYRRNRELRGKEAAEIGASVLKKILAGSDGSFVRAPEGFPTVVCLVGVNGAGKTTTAAKLARLFAEGGEKVLLGACDTFRAAANEQIGEWAERLGIDIVESRMGADSAAAAFDAWQAAKARGAKWLIIDTAGRLHTKENLMGELAKIRRVLAKNDPSAPHNCAIVLDASHGSNAIEQAKAFHGSFALTCAIVTKLDGTGKGGALVGVYRSLNIPIAYVGFGERAEDLQKFDSAAYADGVFGLDS